MNISFMDIEVVIDEAVWRMIEQEAQLREEIRLGIEAADKGEFASFDVDEMIVEIVAEDSWYMPKLRILEQLKYLSDAFNKGGQ